MLILFAPIIRKSPAKPFLLLLNFRNRCVDTIGVSEKLLIRAQSQHSEYKHRQNEGNDNNNEVQPQRRDEDVYQRGSARLPVSTAVSTD